MDTSKVERTPRVFITNFAGHNYKGAKKYGTLISMTRGYVSFESLDRIKYNLFEVIVKESHPDDYLLLSGVPALSAMASALWYAHHNCIKLLVWDKKAADYGAPTYREVIIDNENYNDMLIEVMK